MWENSPMLQFSAFCILKARILVFDVGVKIVVMCFNNRQPYVHVRFHDQFV